MEWELGREGREVIADLFVNLAAGWFGLVLITPTFGEAGVLAQIFTALTNFGLGGFCLWLSYIMKKGGQDD